MTNLHDFIKNYISEIYKDTEFTQEHLNAMVKVMYPHAGLTVDPFYDGHKCAVIGGVAVTMNGLFLSSIEGIEFDHDTALLRDPKFVTSVSLMVKLGVWNNILESIRVMHQIQDFFHFRRYRQCG